LGEPFNLTHEQIQRTQLKPADDAQGLIISSALALSQHRKVTPPISATTLNVTTKYSIS